MKSRPRKELNRRTSGWDECDQSTARKALAFYRATMDRLRLEDVAAELKWLETAFEKRAKCIKACGKDQGFTAKERAEVFEYLESGDRNLGRRMAKLREKIGWVLTP